MAKNTAAANTGRGARLRVRASTARHCAAVGLSHTAATSVATSTQV